MLQSQIVGHKHYKTVQEIKKTLQHYKQLQDITAILELNELSKEDRLVVARARKIKQFLLQSFFMPEVFTGSLGKNVGAGQRRLDLASEEGGSDWQGRVGKGLSGRAH